MLNNLIKKNQGALATTAIVGASGTVMAGNTLSMVAGNVETGTLSAIFTVTAATSTLTIAAKWQVSQDNGVTWVDATVPQNPANVVLTTGTAAETKKVLDAPAAVYGHDKVRACIVTGVTTAGAGDQYAIGYNFRVRRGYK